MKRNTLSKIFLVIVMLSFYACKAKKGIVNTNKETVEKTKVNKNDFSKIKAKQSNFNAFSTKAITKLTLGDKSFDVTLNIRIKKGEKIWVSVTYLAGIEVARVLITPDSIKIIDRFNDGYIKKPFSYVQGYTNNQIDYQTLEAILIGDCIPFTLQDNSSLNVNNGLLSLTGKSGEIAFHIGFNDQIKPQTTLLYSEQQQNLSVTIGSFENIMNQLLPKNIEINSVADKKQIKVQMEYAKTQLNEELDFPFNVPKRFSVID